MNWKPEDLPALHLLEYSIMGVWRKHPAMTDHVADRAYEAAFQHYRALARGHVPKPHGFIGLDLEAIDAVLAACSTLATSGAPPLPGSKGGPIPPLSKERLLDYLRELRRSVERHGARGGHRGYLEFLDGYVL